MLDRTPSIPRRAMVLAAGHGVRMRPLTDRVPKPLIEVGGKALDRSRARSARRGRGRAGGGQRASPRRPDRATTSRAGARRRSSSPTSATQLLDTGGGVVKALPLLGEAPFFHVNSDTLWIDGVKPNLDRLAEAFDATRMDALLLLAPTATSIGYGGRGDFAMAPDGRLQPARRTRGGAVRLCGRGDPVARAVRRRACGRRFRSHVCSTGRRRPGACMASASKACGCTSARPTRLPRPRPRSGPTRPEAAAAPGACAAW